VSGENVVRILVTGDNDMQPVFDETKAGAEDMAAKVSAAYGEYTAAANEAAQAQARLDELQADSGASADEVAAAQDRVTAATLASIDAQVKLGQAELEQSAAARDSRDATDESAASTDAAGASAVGFGSKMKLAALGLAAGAAVSIKMAADWQTSLTQLTTSAGEPVKALGALRQGILSLSVGTDTSVKELTSGLYMISSAGFTGARGLDVLKAAAEGAKSEGASLADVSNVLTSAMNAYNIPASRAAATTNQLIATVASGKMHLQDLATSLSSVLPVAASAHISLAQVGGAIATMTMQGMSAHRATMDLANMIRSLIDPSATASHEMQALGLNANTVAKQIGSRGLTGTLSTLTEAILRNSKGGMVLAGDMQKMTPAAQALSDKILSGSISFLKAKTAMQALNPVQEKLVSNFQSQAQSATGLKQTFDAAMSKMVGGATGLNVALLIGGKHMDAFQKNVKTISAAAKDGGANISGWSRIQENFNFKLGAAGKAAQAVAYSLGDALLPAATKVMGVIASFGQWLVKNKAAAVALAAVIGGTLATVVGGKLITSVMGAVEAFGKLGAALGIAGEAEEGASASAGGLGAAMDVALGPVGLIIAAIAVLAIGFIELWKHFKGFRDFWKDAWRDIKQVADGALSGIKSSLRALAGLWGDISRPVVRAFDEIRNAITHGFDSWWKSNGKEIEEVWKVTWDVIRAVVKAVWDYISAVTRIGWDIMMAILKPGLDLLLMYFRLTFDEIKAIVKTAWDIIAAVAKIAFAGIVLVVKTAWDVIVGLFDIALALVTGHWGKAWNDLETMLSQVWNNIRQYFAAVWNAIKDLAVQVVNNIKGFLSSAWNDIKSGVESAFSAILHFIASVWDHIRHFFAAGADDVVRLTKDLWDREVSGFRNIWHDVTDIVRRLWHDVFAFFAQLGQDVDALVEHLWHNEVSNWERIYHDTLTWVQRLFHDAVSWFEKLPGRIMSVLASLPSKLFNLGAHIIEMLAHGITSAVGDVTHAIGGIASEIVGHLPSSPAKKGPLSGSGDPQLRGRHIAELLGQGMLSGLPDISMAANRMAGAAGVGPGGVRGYGAAGGGALTLEVVGGGSGLDELFITWLKEKVRIKGGGGIYSVQKALGSGNFPRGA
jgi:TP901 family phage tail tape measure protein